MECLGPLLILVGLVLAFYALVLRPTVLGDRWSGPLRQVAIKFHGTYESGGWFGTPKVRFRDATGMLQVEVRPVGQGGRPHCCITADLPGVVLTGTIVAASGTWPTGQHGVSADALGDFILYTDQREEGQLLMTDGVRWILTQLQHTPERNDVNVELTPQRLVVRKPWYSAKQADWERYVGLVLGLRDQLLLGGASAIEFTPGTGMVDYLDAKCPFCGEPVTEQPVLCRACRTPHHKECWEANGTCSTYGCKENLYVVPSPARWRGEQATRRPPKPR